MEAQLWRPKEAKTPEPKKDATEATILTNLRTQASRTAEFILAVSTQEHLVEQTDIFSRF